MAFSYSFHLSTKSHAVGTVGRVGQVSRHNLREYESANYDRSQIEILRGSDKSILDNVKRIYQEEFTEELQRYNEGKRNDRKINDYLTHVSDSRSDCACELIIQIGDKDFWAEKTMEERKQMSWIFQDQIRSLEKLVPELKIASAIVHYDESSPHMHIVGVPIAEGYKIGMKKQVAKTKVFTADRLSYLQDKMRENAERGMKMEQNRNIFGDMELKEKQKGRNKDIPKQSLDEFYELKGENEKIRQELEQTQAEKEKEVTAVNMLSNVSRRLSDPKRTEDVVIPTPNGDITLTPVPELHRRVKKLQAEINTQKTVMGQNEANLSSQEQELSQKRAALEDLDSQITHKKEDVDLLDARITNKKQSLEFISQSYERISAKTAEHKPPEMAVKAVKVVDQPKSWGKEEISHREYYLKIPAKSKEAAEGIQREITDLYTKQASKEAFKDVSEAAEKAAREQADNALHDAQGQIQEAQRIIQERESILERAKKKADEIIRAAKAKLQALRTEIAQLLHKRDRIIEDAQIEADNIIQNAHKKTGTGELYNEINRRLGIIPLKEKAEARKTMESWYEKCEPYMDISERDAFKNLDTEALHNAWYARTSGNPKFGVGDPVAFSKLKKAAVHYAAIVNKPTDADDVLREIQDSLQHIPEPEISESTIGER